MTKEQAIADILARHERAAKHVRENPIYIKTEEKSND